MLSRRELLTASAAAAFVAVTPKFGRFVSATAPAAPAIQPALKNKRFKVAGDDLFLLLRQNIKAFARAKESTLDGLALDMGSMSGGKTHTNALRDPATRQQFLDESKKTGIDICSLSFFALYAWNFPKLPFALEATTEWVDLMDKMNVRVGHMPIMCPDFVLGKLTEPPPDRLKTDEQKAKWELVQKEQPESYSKTVEIFRKVAPAAEKAGVIMGVESNVDADGYIKFLDAVGSKNVRVVYNPGVGLENKFDVYADIEKLGKDRICMLHLEQGTVPPDGWERRLGDGLINFPKLRESIMKINWDGWMTIARSRLKGTTSPQPNMKANAAYVREIFPE